MKSQLLHIPSIMIAMFFTLAGAFADETMPATVPANHPCHNIHKACKDAGFIKGQWKQKNGLWANCIDPIAANPNQTITNANGKTVNGAQFSADASACNAKIQERKAAKKAAKSAH